MKIGIYNDDNSYLFKYLEEGCKKNGYDAESYFLKDSANVGADAVALVKKVMEVKKAMSTCDWVICVNYNPTFEIWEMFPLEKTIVMFFDPPSHFPTPQKVGTVIQMLEFGPYPRVEWGAMDRFFNPGVEDIHYACAACIRLYRSQAAVAFQQNNIPISASFELAELERVQGVLMAMKMPQFQPLAVFGGADFKRYGIMCAPLNSEDDLHTIMARATNILDHNRSEIGLNPKYIYASAMNKPYWLIERNPTTNQIEINRKPLLKPRHIKDTVKEIMEIAEQNAARRNSNYKTVAEHEAKPDYTKLVAPPKEDYSNHTNTFALQIKAMSEAAKTTKETTNGK